MLYNEGMENRPASEVSELLRLILSKRGYQTDAEVARFLRPDYETELHDPYLLTDMQLAVERIVAAIENKDPIAIYGDYDIDGLTATSLMLDFLGGLGADVIGYIPDRFEEGYGINREALAKLQKQGIKLVISVDCGITSRPEAAWAKSHGLDLIITDHHAVPEQLPQAIACINPKRPGDAYPFKDLAGVGVAFKLAQAIQSQVGKPAPGQERWLLDLVALGTVCDVVTLVGENRVLVRYGLKVLAKTRRIGLQALAEVAGVNLAGVSSYHLGFILGPRLNAAGRLETAAQALALLTTDDAVLAAEAAQRLDQLNLERREQQAIITTQANALAERYPNDPILVLADSEWAQGVVGIVASKLLERWHKPTILLQILGETAKGSGRSTGWFNLIDNLRALDPDIFLKLGGHHFAAGFTIPTARIDDLRTGLIERASAQPGDRSVTTPADLEVSNFGDLSLGLVADLDQLEPFGNGNPKPILATPKATVIKVSQVGTNAQHLKLVLADNDGVSIAGIGFNMAEFHPNLSVGQQVEAEFHLVENDFSGYPKPEIIISKLR